MKLEISTLKLEISTFKLKISSFKVDLEFQLCLVYSIICPQETLVKSGIKSLMFSVQYNLSSRNARKVGNRVHYV